MISCAASAGPAFEGSGVSCGMRARKGAIQRVKINKSTYESDVTTILNSKSAGICGSGYIDLIAEMLRAGIIDKSGKIKDIENKHIRVGKLGKEFVVDDNIYINDVDIDNIKRAKGAIYSAAAILVKHMELNFSDIKKVFIAGGFGNYLDMENAITIGLLPDIERSKFKFVGNSSLLGAREIMLSSDAARKAEEIAKKITYFELSTDPKYMDEYVAALFFPHTDANRFANIKL